jgi:hypothetical protein
VNNRAAAHVVVTYDHIASRVLEDDTNQFVPTGCPLSIDHGKVLPFNEAQNMSGGRLSADCPHVCEQKIQAYGIIHLTGTATDDINLYIQKPIH